MADYTVQVLDYITLYDTPVAYADLSDVVQSVMDLSDSTDNFDRFIVSSPGPVGLSDVTDAELSAVKRVFGDSIDFTDTTSQYVTYRDGTSDDSGEVIELTDDSVGYVSTSAGSDDTFLIGTRSYANVDYVNNDSDDTMSFIDSVTGIVSRYITRQFKNAVASLVGTTETTLYTCSGDNTVMMNLSLCNRTLGDVLIDVMIYRGATPTYILDGFTLGSHEVYVINSTEENSIVLEANDEIRVVTDTANSSDFYMAVIEQNIG